VQVVFIHGPAASGKHTIGALLGASTGLPLFHNHLAVDAAKVLFEFGTPGFNKLRATVWLTAFAEAAKAGRSFIFTFHPEASVEPALIDEMVRSVEAAGGSVRFVELRCSSESILQRLGNASRRQFGKLTDAALYASIEGEGGFEFPPLPAASVVVDTDRLSPEQAAASIATALGLRRPA
jgi:hypothetical protein